MEEIRKYQKRSVGTVILAVVLIALGLLALISVFFDGCKACRSICVSDPYCWRYSDSD